MAYRPAISVSGGQRLKVLKNRNFLILLFSSLYEGVWGVPKLINREATLLPHDFSS